MKRVTPVPSQDLGCATARRDYKSTADYERFLKGNIQQRVDVIGGYTGSQIELLKNSRDPQQSQAYLNAINNLQLAENLLAQNISCINKDLLQRNEYSSRIYTLQQEIEALRKEAQDKKEIVSEAKDRASTLENPYNKTTKYELWFPLGRPIRKENVPVLLSVSILMLVFSIGIFLRIAGLELRLDSIQSASNSIFKSVNPAKYQ